MRIEVLFEPGCPNYAPTVESVMDILRELRLPQEIIKIQVTDPAQAVAMALPGSPTVRVNGKDVEPNLPKTNLQGLTCRTYLVDGKSQGVPKREWIFNAIVRARQLEAGSV